jgi:putative component of membrane protein insertase Oxa1/YidC/SpoIIIJ protein YidD
MLTSSASDGIVRGLLRCRPWRSGGHDPVPQLLYGEHQLVELTFD